MMRRLVLALWLSLLLAVPAYAAAGAEPLVAEATQDPALETRVQRVASELRCLVCQNQTIADSNAELAQDLRREVRRMLARGDSEAQVRQFMVERYGNFILYRPPLDASTWLLWAGPFVLLLGGAWMLRRIALERRRKTEAPAALSPEDQARLAALVSGRETGPR
jgi:cytochrome c-type biogenesis protein CcmH